MKNSKKTHFMIHKFQQVELGLKYNHQSYLTILSVLNPVSNQKPYQEHNDQK